jgi:hypothetical protein
MYLGANKNLRNIPRHTNIHYLYFYWRYLLLHSPSVEIPFLGVEMEKNLPTIVSNTYGCTS